MTTGMYAQCTANEVLKYNFFENLDEDAILEAVGTHCKLPYCVCGHADAHNLIPGGCNFCEKIDSANEELQWVTEEMRWIQNANLAYSNEEFTEEKKASCNDRNTMYNYVQHTANLIRCDFREERYDKVIERAEEILVGDLNPRNYWILDVILKYGYALLRTGKMEQALDLASCYEELNYNADYCLLMGLIYLQNGQIENAISLFEEATTKYSWFENGTNSFMAWYNLGVIYECLGDVEKATAYYKKCGDYQDAKHRLNEIY
jgi:tetratricopeptide (TPR) repeat protein